VALNRIPQEPHKSGRLELAQVPLKRKEGPPVNSLEKRYSENALIFARPGCWRAVGHVRAKKEHPRFPSVAWETSRGRKHYYPSREKKCLTGSRLARTTTEKDVLREKCRGFVSASNRMQVLPKKMAEDFSLEYLHNRSGGGGAHRRQKKKSLKKNATQLHKEKLKSQEDPTRP